MYAYSDVGVLLETVNRLVEQNNVGKMSTLKLKVVSCYDKLSLASFTSWVCRVI